jgi:hypothetical protein
MANSIDWGKTYCEIHDNDGFGDEQWSTFYIPDISAPDCWGLVPVTPFTADIISYFGGELRADNTTFKADKTQL